MQSVSIFQAGDGENSSQDPTRLERLPEAATTRRPRPEAERPPLSGRVSARCPAPPRAARLGAHSRATGGSGPQTTARLTPWNQGAHPGADLAAARGPAPLILLPQGGRSRSLGPPPGAQPPPRPALTLHVVQLGPLLLQFALEALGLSLQRCQRLVLVQPVGCHLRARTRRGGKPRAGWRVSGGGGLAGEGAGAAPGAAPAACSLSAAPPSGADAGGWEPGCGGRLPPRGSARPRPSAPLPRPPPWHLRRAPGAVPGAMHAVALRRTPLGKAGRVVPLLPVGKPRLRGDNVTPPTCSEGPNGIPVQDLLAPRTQRRPRDTAFLPAPSLALISSQWDLIGCRMAATCRVDGQGEGNEARSAPTPDS